MIQGKPTSMKEDWPSASQLLSKLLIQKKANLSSSLSLNISLPLFLCLLQHRCGCCNDA